MDPVGSLLSLVVGQWTWRFPNDPSGKAVDPEGSLLSIQIIQWTLAVPYCPER